MLNPPESILKMHKLALVGKNISHSMSPALYKKLLSSSVEYDLLDYKDISQIPAVEILMSNYDGINITSPYKKHFIGQVELVGAAKKIGAINCLKKSEGRILGANTDYYAVMDQLRLFLETHESLNVVVLGDGVMSTVTQESLMKLRVPFKIFSRKLTDQFHQLDLINFFASSEMRPLIINTCSRDYVFNGDLPKNSIFWDYNYNFSAHSSLLAPKIFQYLDGLKMLEDQAKYAVAFWSGVDFPNS